MANQQTEKYVESSWKEWHQHVV